MKISKLALALCSTSLWGGGAWAQTVAATAPPPASANSIAEIVVTAQKRSERLSDVPMSITAVTGSQLAKAGVTSVADLATVVPGFTYTRSSYGVPVYTLRGVGFYDIAIGGSPTVSVYVDQAPLPYSAMTKAADLDLERVEVLKGPQGTLFGQNSTGGAINYIAAKPTRTFDFGGDLTYGRFNAFTANAFLSGPLTDTLSARLALRTNQGGAWQSSYTRDAHLGKKNFNAARLLLDWRPKDDLSFELNVNGYKDNSENQAAQYIAYSPLQNPGYPEQAAILPNYPRAPRNARAADWDQGRKLSRDDSFNQVSLRADWIISDLVTLTSISAYSYLETKSPVDSDGVNFGNFFSTTRGKLASGSQELRAAGELTRTLKYMVGVNYEKSQTRESFLGMLTSSNNGLGPFRFPDFINLHNEDIETKSVFGSLDYEIVPAVTLRGSARYTSQDRSFAGCVQDPGDGGSATVAGVLSTSLTGIPTLVPPGACGTLGADNRPLPIVNSSLDQDNFSWRLGADWKTTTNSLVYFNVTKGYKAGAYSTLPAVKAAQFTPVTQEALLAYEVGVKSDFFERTLTLDAAAFYYDYRNKQIVGYIDVGPPFGNLPGLVSIPKSRVKGAEVNLTWLPIRDLHINLGATYVDSRVTSDFHTPDPFGDASGNIRGQAFPLTPKWQLTSDIEYGHSVAANWTAFAGANVSYRTSTYAAFGESPLFKTLFKIDGYALVNLRLGVQQIDGPLRLELWARNVTDKYYWTNTNHVTDTVSRYAGLPATVGVTLSYRR